MTIRSPYLCTVRLNLAVSQVVPDMATLQALICSVYTFIDQSASRSQRFQEMAAIMEVNMVRFKQVFDIRWLSLGNCVAALIRNYEPLMAVLEKSAAEGDATAIGLHLQLSHTHFVHLMHFVGDVLAETNALNCHFQERGVNFSSIRHAIQDCCSGLQALLTENGKHMVQLATQLAETPTSYKGVELKQSRGRGEAGHPAAYMAVKAALIDKLLANLTSRLPQVDERHAG